MNLKKCLEVCRNSCFVVLVWSKHMSNTFAEGAFDSVEHSICFSRLLFLPCLLRRMTRQVVTAVVLF